jgi:hypothetical protein
MSTPRLHVACTSSNTPCCPAATIEGGWRVDDVRLLMMIRKIFPADLKLAPIDTLSTQNVRQAELRFLLDTQY